MAVQKGLGVVFGISSTGIILKTVASTSASSWTDSDHSTSSGTKGKWRFTGQSISKGGETVQLRDENGATLGQVIYDKNQELSLTCYPSGSTLAKAKAANVLPAIGDRAVVKEPYAANTYDGDVGSKAQGTSYRYNNYIVTGAAKSKSQTDIVSFDVTLQRFDSNNETTGDDASSAVQDSNTITAN